MLENGDYIASISGLNMEYSVRGEGEILFVTSPGWGIGTKYLQKGLAPLTDHFKLVFVTTRGSGQSQRPSDPSQMGSAQMADDLEHLRLHLGLDAINLFGHSNGGAIAISYAERYPDNLRNLVLVSSQLLGFDTSGEIAGFLERAKTDPRYMAAAPYALQALPQDDAGFYHHFTSMVPLYLREPSKNAQTFIDHMGGRPSAWAFHSQFAVDALPAANEVEDLKNIQARTLIVVGRHCWICPVAVSEHLHGEIAGSKLLVFEKTGHFPWLEEPERFFDEVGDFLSQA